MKRKKTSRPFRQLFKAGCIGAGLLSISNPTHVTAADVGMMDVHNGVSLGTIDNPFPHAPGGVHVAAGDLNGDGVAELVLGPGRGSATFAVVPTSKRNVRYITDSVGIPPGAGVRVATGDLNGDGKSDIIVTPATGHDSSGSFLKLPDLEGPVGVLATFDNIFDGFSGGANTATGDFNGDGAPDDDVLAGRLSCACGRPIKIKKPPLGAAGFADFGPPAPHGHGGVQVAAGDFDGDGLDDAMILPNDPPSGIAQPLIATAKDKYDRWIILDGFTEPSHVNIAVGDLDNDGIPDLVVGSARGFIPYIKWYEIAATPGVPDSFSALLQGEFAPYDPSFLGGVRVAVGDVNGDGFQDIAFAPASIPEPGTIASFLVGLGTWLMGGSRRRRQ